MAEDVIIGPNSVPSLPTPNSAGKGSGSQCDYLGWEGGYKLFPFPSLSLLLSLTPSFSIAFVAFKMQ